MIPILVVVDIDNYKQRELIDSATEAGFAFLFEEQVISFSNAYRQVAYDKIIEGAQRAIVRRVKSLKESPPKDTTTSPASENLKLSSPRTGSSVSSSAVHTSLNDQFRTAVLAKYGSTEKAWVAFDILNEPKGQLTRTDWKSCLKMIGLNITSKEKGKLRKNMDKSNRKIISAEDFKAFMSNSTESSIAARPKHEQKVGLANVPFDSPALPDNYRVRPDVENKLIDLLVGTTVCKGSVVCAFGMGGAG